MDALLDEHTPLDLLAAIPEHAELVARHPSLSWTRLVGASSDPEAIRVVWSSAWRIAYEHDVARAQALLDDDRLRLDAADDPQLAALCLLRIGGLAWRGATVAELLEAYRAAIPPHPVLDELLSSIELDIAAAASLCDTWPEADRWIGPVRALLAAGRVGDPDGRRAAARAVMVALERDVDAALRELDALHNDLDLGPLFEAIYTQLPPGSTRLDALGEAAFDHLTHALHELGHEPHKWMAVGGTLAATVLVGATGGLGDRRARRGGSGAPGVMAEVPLEITSAGIARRHAQRGRATPKQPEPGSAWSRTGAADRPVSSQAIRALPYLLAARSGGGGTTASRPWELGACARARRGSRRFRGAGERARDQKVWSAKWNSR